MEAMDGMDVDSIRKKFKFLSEFSDNFVKNTPLDTLLRMETTSMKIQEFERSKAASSRLTSNRDSIASTFTKVKDGQDNRWDSLHPARFLPGAGCSAAKIWLRAREVLGEKGTVPISTYDMASVGLAGYVSKRGWCEMHDPGSDAISIKMFNINSCTSKVSTVATQGEEFKDIVDLGEFKLALRAAREAMAFMFPWNKSIAAMEGFMFRTNFCAADMAGVEKPATTLTQFVDFALEANADRWKNQEAFMSTGELKTAWDSFYGARPESALPKGKTGVGLGKGKEPAKPKGIFDDRCRAFNMGKCVKPPTTCTTRNGIPLRHTCNFRTNQADPATACDKPHPRCFNH